MDEPSVVRRALDHAGHSGFPWSMGGGAGHSRALRKALRRSVVGRWPRRYRLLGQVLMTLFWPVESLRDALVFSFQVDRAALGKRARLGVALRAWAAALRHNLPPVDYLSYRLFRPDQPGPGHWLHSADAHFHFRALASPEVCALAEDKLAFADFAETLGVTAMPVLAAYGRGGPVRPIGGAGPPPCDLMVKPRSGHGSRGQSVWRWDGARHVQEGGGPEGTFDSWMSRAARSGDMVVQELVRPPENLWHLSHTRAPVVSIVTAQWPGGRREPGFALVAMNLHWEGREIRCSREIDLETGAVLAASPGQRVPAWGSEPDARELGAFVIPGWQDILAQIDRLHGALPGPAPVLKWDIILTDEGAKLLETNTGTGVYVLQTMTLRPITASPIGVALEAWAQ